MSQNPPETGSEYDQGFLDSDVDLQIGRPPSDGKVVTRSASALWSLVGCLQAAITLATKEG
jgi:hypothetical protein